MPFRRLTFRLFVLFGILPAIAFAQSPPKAEPPPTASVSGRVTLDGQPVAGARVSLFAKSTFDKPVTGVTTDAAGRFRLASLPDGAFVLWVTLGANVFEDETETVIGKEVILEPGEAIEEVELRLRPGGVITGRVTDAENRPVIGQRITLQRLRKNPRTGQEEPGGFGAYFTNPYKFQTDDHGVYRIYGLPPGRYIVGVGDVKIEGQRNFNLGGRNTLPGTFHPKATEWRDAAVVVLAAGQVEEKRDIAVGRPLRNFTIAGKVVDDETGAPVAKLAIGLLATDPGGSSNTFSGFSDASGEFLLSNVKSGTYRVQTVSFIQENDYFSEPVTVEVRGEDLKDVTIRAKRGITLSGRLVPDGGAAPDTIQFGDQSIGVGAVNLAPGDFPSSNSARVAPDGSFTLRGVKPNQVYRFTLFNQPKRRMDLGIATVRRAGADVPPAGLEVGAESIADLQIVVVKTLGRLRGEIRFVGGAPDKSVRYSIELKPVDRSPISNNFAWLDERNRFLIENLAGGTYRVQVWSMGGGHPRTELKLVTPQTVTIPETGDGTVVLTVDLSNPSESKPQ